MFDLEKAIAEWRQQMLAAGIDSREQLEELEGHLRDVAEAQMRLGVSEEVAFETALEQIGRPEDLEPEYAKVGITVYEWINQWWCGLTGIQNNQLITNMNHSNRNLEPRWATYAKGSAFILPAVVVWAGFCLLVLPKLNQIRLASGMEMWRPVAAALAATEFIKVNFILLSVMAVVALVLLEWRSGWWMRHRRLIFGVAAYGLNILVLGLMAMLAVLAVVAGAHFLPGK